MTENSNPPVEGFDSFVASSLRMAQAEKDVTNVVLSERSGIPVRTLIRYLKGQREMNTSTIQVLADSLGTSPEALIERARQLATSTSGLTWEQYALAAFHGLKEPKDEDQ